MPRMRRARRVGALLMAAGLAFSLAACTTDATASVPNPQQVDADLSADAQAQFTEATEFAIAATGSSGAIVGVWVPWAGQWVEGLGTVTPGGAAAEPDLTVRAGFVTRAMTCDVLYALVAQRTVSLDDPVTNWVRTSAEAQDVTLGQLCDSTSGIASYGGQIMDRLLEVPARHWNPRELAAYGLAVEPQFDAGTQFRDSDTGYILLGTALERAAESSLDELYEEYVFEPLGMNSSSIPENAPESGIFDGLYSANDGDGNPNCAEPQNVSALSPSSGYSAAGVLSTVSDLGRYVRALATGARAYDADSRFESPLPATSTASAWFTAKGGTYQAGSLVGQYGSVPGAQTAAFADTETGLTVVVVLNNSRGTNTAARDLAWSLAAIATKLPGAEGETAPETGLPWTAEQFQESLAKGAICPTS